MTLPFDVQEMTGMYQIFKHKQIFMNLTHFTSSGAIHNDAFQKQQHTPFY